MSTKNEREEAEVQPHDAPVAKKPKLAEEAAAPETTATAVDATTEKMEPTEKKKEEVASTSTTSDVNGLTEETSNDKKETASGATKPATTSGFAGFAGFAAFQSTGSSGFSSFASKASSSSTSTGFGGGFASSSTGSGFTGGFGTTVEKTPETSTIVPALSEAELANGEEEEEIVVEKRAKLFKLVDQDYVEVGIGPFRVLKSKSATDPEQAKASARIVMRRESYPRGPGTKLLLNARLTACLTCTQKADKAMVLTVLEKNEDDDDNAKVKPSTYLIRCGSVDEFTVLRQGITKFMPTAAPSS